MWHMRLIVVMTALALGACANAKSGGPSAAAPAAAQPAATAAGSGSAPAGTASGTGSAPAETATGSGSAAAGGSPEGPGGETQTQTADRDSVIAIPAAARMLHTGASLFDLKGKILHFTPKVGGYSVSVTNSATLGARGTALTITGNPFDYSLAYALPFAFPFGGKAHTALYVNTRGNLSFERPETELIAERSPHTDGGMVSVSAALDVRSRAGVEQMIAGFWANFGKTLTYANATSDAVLFTWEAGWTTYGKKDKPNGVDTDLRTSVFQVRLAADGSVDIALTDIKEETGFVGLFPGTEHPSRLLYEAGAIKQSTEAAIQLDALKIYEEGSLIRYSYDLKQALPASIARGTVYFRSDIRHTDKIRYEDRSIQFEQTGTTRKGWGAGPAPASLGYAVNGDVVDLWVAKPAFAWDPKPLVNVDIVWLAEGLDARTLINGRELFTLDLSQPEHPPIDLSAPGDAVWSGNVYEAFHYPLSSRSPLQALRLARETVRADEEFAVVLTEWQQDDMWAAGGSASNYNVAVKGLGEWNEQTTVLPDLPKLQGSLTILPLWSPFLDEKVTDDYELLHHPWPVALVAHELGHRWGVQASIYKPGTTERLYAGYSFGHWHDGFHTPSVYKVSDYFGVTPYPEQSPMGGRLWTKRNDGLYTPVGRPYRGPSGMSSLDLYYWGLIPAEEVEDTFYIDGLVASGDAYTGTVYPIKIQDVIAVQGPRVPSAADAPKSYRLRVYLLAEGETPRPESLARAEAIDDAIREYYKRASGGLLEMK